MSEREKCIHSKCIHFQVPILFLFYVFLMSALVFYPLLLFFRFADGFSQFFFSVSILFHCISTFFSQPKQRKVSKQNGCVGVTIWQNMNTNSNNFGHVNRFGWTVAASQCIVLFTLDYVFLPYAKRIFSATNES